MRHLRPDSVEASVMGWSEGIGLDNHRFDTTGDRMTSNHMSDPLFTMNVGLSDGSRVRREFHARFCLGLG